MCPGKWYIMRPFDTKLLHSRGEGATIVRGGGGPSNEQAWLPFPTPVRCQFLLAEIVNALAVTKQLDVLQSLTDFLPLKISSLWASMTSLLPGSFVTRTTGPACSINTGILQGLILHLHTPSPACPSQHTLPLKSYQLANDSKSYL